MEMARVFCLRASDDDDCPASIFHRTRQKNVPWGTIPGHLREEIPISQYEPAFLKVQAEGVTTGITTTCPVPSVFGRRPLWS